MKKIIIFLLSIMTIFISTKTLAEHNLRNPQGRMGLTFKTEKYNPSTTTNLSSDDIARLNNIKKNTKEKTNKLTNSEKTNFHKKIEAFKQKQAEKEKQQLIIHQQKEEEKAQKEKQQLLIKKQKELQKAEEEKLKQEEKARLEAIKQQEKEENKELKENQTVQPQEETNEPKKSKYSLSNLNFVKKKQEAKQKQAAEKFQKIEDKIAQPTENINTEQTNINKTKVQDTSTKLIITEITDELNADRPKMLEELSTLWVSAVQKSDTVYFAIMKLSNPNGEEVNKSGFKKIMEPIISAAPLVGQAFVNPALTSASLIGSNLVGSMMNDSTQQRLTKVNDADLVILARAIDELQESLLVRYLDYKSSLKEYEMTIKIADERKKEYEEMNKINSPNTVLANTFYTEALDNQYKARQAFLMRRVVLEQMVGSDALTEIETGKKPNQEEANNNTEEPKPTSAENKPAEQTNNQTNTKAK